MDIKREKIKICFSTWEYPPDKGGVGRSSARIVQYLVEEGYEVHVFVPKNGFVPPSSDLQRGTVVSDQIPDPIQENGATIYRIAAGSSFLEGAQAIYHVIKSIDNQVNFDLFHGFFLPMAYPCILVAQRDRRPVIASIRGTDAVTFLTNELMPYIQVVLQNATWVTSVSSDLLETVCALSDISAHSSFIPNSIDISEFENWELSKADCLTVGSVALFRPKKNIPLLLEAYSHLPLQCRDKLLLVGEFSEESSEKEKILNFIEKNNLDDEVEITGFVSRDQVKHHLLQMKVFVQCSKHEGLPNALLEACATGVPIVATSVDGMKDILEDGISALLSPSDNREALCKNIAAVLTNPDLAQKLSRGALNVAKQLGPDQEKKNWINLYSQILEVSDRL